MTLLACKYPIRSEQKARQYILKPYIIIDDRQSAPTGHAAHVCGSRATFHILIADNGSSTFFRPRSRDSISQSCSSFQVVGYRKNAEEGLYICVRALEFEVSRVLISDDWSVRWRYTAYRRNQLRWLKILPPTISALYCGVCLMILPLVAGWLGLTIWVCVRVC